MNETADTAKPCGRASLPRQESLFRILDAAKQDAIESGEDIYIIYAPIYVDDYEEGVHVYATRDGALIMYPKRESWTKAGIEWSIDCHVAPSGELFFTRVEDIMHSVAIAIS